MARGMAVCPVTEPPPAEASGEVRDLMPFTVARSRDEAHLYLDLHPCDECGSVDTTWDSALGWWSCSASQVQNAVAWMNSSWA